MQEDSLFSTPSPAFVICRLFTDGHSQWCEVHLSIVLTCISLIMSEVEPLFFVLFGHLSSLENVYLDLLPTFGLGFAGGVV